VTSKMWMICEYSFIDQYEIKSHSALCFVLQDVDTIYLSQDTKELCLRDFDHLKER